MKTKSLQEKYNNDRIKILLEQLDQADLQNIANAFERIDRIIGPLDTKLPAIDNPIEKARQDLSQMLSGEGGLLKRMFRNITGTQQKTLMSVMEAQIQIVSLFRAMPGIMTLAGKGTKSKIAQAPGRRAVGQGEMGDEELEDSGGLTRANTVADAVGPQAAKTMTSLIAKALKPAQVGSTPINPVSAAQQIMELSADEFSSFAGRAGGSEIKVPVKKQDVEAIQDKTEDHEAKEAGGKAQQLLADLTKGDKDRAKVMKTFLDQVQGMTGKDLELVKNGLDKYLGK